MKSDMRDTVVGALGAARMAPYLFAADSNKKRALALYRWSVELGHQFKKRSELPRCLFAMR